MLSIHSKIRRAFHIHRRCKKAVFKKWNYIKFRLQGVKIGKKPIIQNSVYLELNNGASLLIGDNFNFKSGDAINPLARNIRGCIKVAENATVIIGNDVGMSGTVIRAQQSITIGNNVKIGANTIILDTDSHSLDYRIRRTAADSNQAKCAPVIIEDDVLVGLNSIILKGVTIGARSVIGAGSVVVKDIPADCIAAGNPCKVIKYLK